MNEIEVLIRKANWYYYNTGTPIMSDYEYDQLVRKLKEENPNSPVLREIGANPKEGAILHYKKLYSIQNVFNEEEMNKFLNRITPNSLIASLKVDGAAVELIYDKGKLISASTRGNGLYGDDCFSLVSKIVPTKINLLPLAQVVGEVIIPTDLFDTKFKEDFSSPRNLASGSLNTKDDPMILKKRGAKFIAYSICIEGISQESYLDDLSLLSSLGFPIVPFESLLFPKFNSQEISAINDRLFHQGDHLFYPYDGIVYRVNTHKIAEEMGYSEKYPRFSIAYKKAEEIITTKIKRIRLDISKNGILTPVAELEPVWLSGAEIKNVTLHNYRMVKENKLGPGAIIEIKRSGGVIPKFLRTIKVGETFSPKECPYCGAELSYDGVRLFCPNKYGCKPQLVDFLTSFIEKIGFKGLSEKSVEKLVNNHLMKTPADLFRLTPKSLVIALGYKYDHAEQVIQEISKFKVLYLDTLLYSLNLPMLGKVNSRKIAENISYSDLSKLILENGHDLYQFLLSLFGPTQTDIIYDALINHFTEFDRDFLEAGVVIRDRIYSTKNNNGFKFVITGTLSRPRSEYAKVIEENGHIFMKSITKETDFLVMGENVGTNKLIKAKKYGVKIINENKLREILGV